MASPPPKKVRLSPDSSAAATPSSNILQTPAEIAVGITEYVNPTLPSWSGVLKQRYTDFLVNEVLPSGEVLHFRSASAPKGESEAGSKKEKRDERTNAPKPVKAEDFVVCHLTLILAKGSGFF
jgi:tRNA pseudouridine13 synthase